MSEPDGFAPVMTLGTLHPAFRAAAVRNALATLEPDIGCRAEPPLAADQAAADAERR